MAEMHAQKDSDFQHLSRQKNVKSVKSCENCVVLENQLSSMQEQLKAAKLVINFLTKNMEVKEANLDMRVKGINSEQTEKKLSTWSDVVKGVKKSDIDMRQSGITRIQVIVNQESEEKLEGVNMKRSDMRVWNYKEIIDKITQYSAFRPVKSTYAEGETIHKISTIINGETNTGSNDGSELCGSNKLHISDCAIRMKAKQLISFEKKA
jgi:hypothetical protein